METRIKWTKLIYLFLPDQYNIFFNYCKQCCVLLIANIFFISVLTSFGKALPTVNWYLGIILVTFPIL